MCDCCFLLLFPAIVEMICFLETFLEPSWTFLDCVFFVGPVSGPVSGVC